MTQTNGHPTPPPVAPPLPKPVTLERKLEVNVYDGNYCQESIEPTETDIVNWAKANGFELDARVFTDAELTAECARRGLLRSEPDAGVAPRALACNRTRRLRCPCGPCEEMRAGAEEEPARDTERPPANQEAHAPKACRKHETTGARPGVCLACNALSCPPSGDFEIVFGDRAETDASSTRSVFEHHYREQAYARQEAGLTPSPLNGAHLEALLRVLEEAPKAKPRESLRQAVEARLDPHYFAIGDAAVAKLNALIEVLEERLP